MSGKYVWYKQQENTLTMLIRAAYAKRTPYSTT